VALPVILPEAPTILFVGINPGLGSWARSHNFAGPGNPFWRLLHAAGLTPVLLQPEEDRRLAEFGLGLVNLCDRPTRTAAELTRDELRQGRSRLVRRVRRVRPGIVALVGISIFPAVFPGATERGPGLRPQQLGDAHVFVLPNPSGLNQSFAGFEPKLVWFRQLAQRAGR
jgi:TDG/mug DNA glycosylase family protein